MLPKHLQLYYSGLAYSLSDHSSYIYLQLLGYFNSDHHTAVTFYYLSDITATKFSLEYLQFYTDILANTYFSTLNDFSVHDKVSYDSFYCETSLSNFLQEHRKYDYDLSVSNPVELNIYEDDIDSLQNHVTYSNYVSLKELSITGLPNAIGMLSVLDNTTLKSKWWLPSNESGWLSSMTIASSMSTRTLEGTCFGLLTSCVHQDLDLIVIQLKEFVNLHKQWGYITLDAQGVWQLSENTVYGIYPEWDVLSYQSTYQIKELPYNALLLFSICSALRLITDAEPTFEYNLDGHWGEFREQLMLCLKAQALFLAASVSPVHNLSSYKASDDYYSYDVLSYSASCYTVIALSMYLSYSYDSYIHTQAAKVQTVLLEFPKDVNSPIFTNFTERDLELVSHDYESNVTDNTNYNKCLNLAAQALWCYYFDGDSIPSTVNQYESLRSTYTVVDNLFISVLVSTNTAVPSFIPTTGLLSGVADKQCFVALSLLTPLSIDTSLDMSQIYAGSCISKDYTYPQNYFDLVALKASAYVTATLLELRRMMPFGMKWFDQSKVNDISTVIGSMLYAEADLYWYWAVQLDTFTKSASSLTAVSEDCLNWFNNKYNLNILASDGFLRHIQTIDNSKDTTTVNGLCNFLSSFLGVDVTYTIPATPSFSIYKQNVTDDLITNYTTNSQSVNLESGYFNRDQYLSIVYKRVLGNWVLRAVPGFPIKPANKPVDVTVKTAEEYLANPTLNVVVQDGPMYIYPLQNYVSQASLNISQVTRHLALALSKASPTGLKLGYTSTLEFIGEE